MTDNTTWQQFFDEHAPAYEDNCFTRNTVAEVDFLIDVLRFPPGAAILDVGCGTGRHAIELARRGYAVTGVDLSAGMLGEARTRAARVGVDVTWLHGDAADFEPPQRFDAAICLCEGAFGLLASVDDAIDQPLAILRNVAKAMKPQAPCVFTVLNGLALIRKHTQADVEQQRFDPLTLAEVSEEPNAGALRERGFVPTELRLLFTMAGLDILHIWGGTAGNWGQRSIDLDEIEIMVVARKSAVHVRC